MLKLPSSILKKFTSFILFVEKEEQEITDVTDKIKETELPVNSPIILSFQER